MVRTLHLQITEEGKAESNEQLDFIANKNNPKRQQEFIQFEEKDSSYTGVGNFLFASCSSGPTISKSDIPLVPEREYLMTLERKLSGTIISLNQLEKLDENECKGAQFKLSFKLPTKSDIYFE